MSGGYWQGKCFSSQSEALDAYYGWQPLAITNGFALRFEKQGITWLAQRYTVEQNGTWTYTGQTVAPSVVFPTCNPAEPFLDGVSIGWGVGACLVLIAGYKAMKAAAR